MLNGRRRRPDCARRPRGLWHDEEADALDPGGRAGQAGEHEVDDVVGHVVLAETDPIFVPVSFQ